METYPTPNIIRRAKLDKYARIKAEWWLLRTGSQVTPHEKNKKADELRDIRIELGSLDFLEYQYAESLSTIYYTQLLWGLEI